MPIYIDTTSVTRRDGITFTKGEGADTKSLAWDRQEARWALTGDLRGGSDAMRDGSIRWLPIEPGEKLNAYRARLSRSHLLGAYPDALDKLVAKPFSRDITFVNDDKLPEMLAAMHEDISRDGTGQTPFWRDVFEESIDKGLTHILVEFPETGGAQTRGQEKRQAIHPYAVHIPARQLIGHKVRTRLGDGREELSQIRIKTTRIEGLEAFGEQEVEYIRIYTAPPDTSGATTDELKAIDPELLTGTFEVWRLDPDKEGEWELFQEATPYSYPGIPLVTLYFCQVGPQEARSCLWKLAELNLEHFQKKSDRDNLMHVAQVPILVRYGFTDIELKKPLTLGAGRSVGTTQKDAKMEYVDSRPAAAALEISKQDIEHLEEQMERMGLEPLIRRASSSLATNMMIGDVKETNLLQAWALLLESAVLAVYKVAAIWAGEEVPEGFEADLFSEFGLSAKATENLNVLDKARARGDLSRETYIEELKRYAALAENLDVQEELERIENEKDSEPDGTTGLADEDLVDGDPAPKAGSGTPNNDDTEETTDAA